MDQAEGTPLEGGEGRARPRPRTQPRAQKASRIWWSVHQWVGLKLSILMSFILFTGTLAVFGHEIDWVLKPGLRVDPASVHGAPNWPAMADALAREAPDVSVISLNAPVDRGFAATAMTTDEDGVRYFALHPATGAIQTDYGGMTAQRVLRFMHRHLMIPTAIGVPIVSSLSILLLISLVTSFVVYKKWWRGFFRPIRFRDARTALGDVHRLAGVWSLWFVALMAATGLWYLVESTVGRAPNHPSVKVAGTTVELNEIAAAMPASLQTLKARHPELRVARILFPNDRSGAFVFQGHHEAVLVRPRSNTVWTNAASAELELITDGRDLNIHQRISEMADPLHFGYFGGVWTKMIWFAFGALLTALSLSGAAIYSTRLARARREPPRWGAGLKDLWRGMGLWRWPALVLVIISFVLWPIVFGA